MTDASQSELTRLMLQNFADALVLQFGTVVFLCAAYFFTVAAFCSALFGLRRLALGWFCLFGCATFLVPSPLTLVISPAVALLSVAGVIWLTIRRRSGQPQAPVMLPP